MPGSSQPLLTAITHRWESGLAERLGRSDVVHVVHRCADLAELLGTVEAGLGRVVVVSSDLRGLDRAVVSDLGGHGLQVLGVHPPDDEDGARALRRWGVTEVLPADADLATLETALERLLGERAGPASDWDRAVEDELEQEPAADPGEARAAGAEDADGAPAAGDVAADRDGPGAQEPREPHEPEDGVPGRGRVVVVWGPAGSPGRTTVAVNLAAEIASPVCGVLLIDADTYAASVAQVLSVLDEAPGVAAAARAADQGTLDREALAALAPEVLPGLRVLTGLPRADRWPELREHAFADILEISRQLADWVVVDVGFGLEQDEELSFDTRAPRRNGPTLAALEVADQVVVAGAGDPVGLQRLVRGLDALDEVNRAPRTVVVTRVRASAVGSDPHRRVRDALARFAGLRDVHLVPDDRAALDGALLAGRVLREHAPRSLARQALRDLAERLTGGAGAAVPAGRQPRRWRLRSSG